MLQSTAHDVHATPSNTLPAQIGTVQQMIKRFREAPPRSRLERLLTQIKELPEVTHTPFWWQQVSALC